VSHISQDVIDRADESQIHHLETCERCRRLLITDVDLDSVLERILSEAWSAPPLVARARPRAIKPWIVLASGAALVLALFLPSLFLEGAGERPDQTRQIQAPVDPGAVRGLANGEGWAVSVWMRGSEICHRESLEGLPGVGEIAGEGCLTPSQFSIPDVLVADVVIMTDESDLPVGGAVFGHVTEAADRLVISFESGEAIVIESGERVEFGLRGYGLPYFDATLLGEPTTIEVYGGDQVLGVYSHTEGRDVSG